MQPRREERSGPAGVSHLLNALLGGSLVIETVFGRPGLGYISVNAIWNKDFPTVQGMVLFMATLYVVINILVDISYAWLDPRVRYDGGS